MIYDVPGAVLSSLLALSNLNLINIKGMSYNYHPHFTEEETKAQKG